MDGSTIVTIMSFVVSIILLIALIFTTVYSNKKGQTDRLENEKEFLNLLNAPVSTTTPPA
jgi:uncharacterized membrane protein